MVRFPTVLTSPYIFLYRLTRLAGGFRWEKGRRGRGRWIGYEILKKQQKVMDDIEESLPDDICGLWILYGADGLVNCL
jgi:hypothetical protein